MHAYLSTSSLFPNSEGVCKGMLSHFFYLHPSSQASHVSINSWAFPWTVMRCHDMANWQVLWDVFVFAKLCMFCFYNHLLLCQINQNCVFFFLWLWWLVSSWCLVADDSSTFSCSAVVSLSVWREAGMGRGVDGWDLSDWWKSNLSLHVPRVYCCVKVFPLPHCVPWFIILCL